LAIKIEEIKREKIHPSIPRPQSAKRTSQIRLGDIGGIELPEADSFTALTLVQPAGGGVCATAGRAGSPPRRDRRPARGERETRRQGRLRSGGDSAHRRGMSSSLPPQQHLIATPSEPVHEREQDGIGDSERPRTAVPHGLATQAGERTERLSRLVSPFA
jgi:hypothetical protein